MALVPLSVPRVRATLFSRAARLVPPYLLRTYPIRWARSRYLTQIGPDLSAIAQLRSGIHFQMVDAQGFRKTPFGSESCKW